MSETNERRGVVICGAYGMDNAGDDAVLGSLIAAMRRIDRTMPVTVLARQPDKTSARFGVDVIHPLRVRRWIGVMRRAELVISGGGTLLQDVTSFRSLLYYLLVIRAGKSCGCAVQLYGCGIGPLQRRISRTITADVINKYADIITARDSRSIGLLREIGVSKPAFILTADPAFAGVFPAGQRERRFGVALRGSRIVRTSMKEITGAVRAVYETRRLEPVFFCLSPEDRTVMRHLRAELADIPGVYSTDAARIGRMSFMISSRLHGLIFAVREGVPAVGIGCDPKVSAFCLDAGIPFIGEDAIGTEQLLAAAEQAMHIDAEELFAAAERMKRRERKNAETSAQLISEGRKS